MDSTQMTQTTGQAVGGGRAPIVMSRKDTAATRRRSTRYAIRHCVVALQRQGLRGWIDSRQLRIAALLDLSRTGLRILSYDAIVPGQSYHCKVHGQGAGSGVVFVAAGVWCKPAVLDLNRFRCGLEIKEISLGQIRQLEHLLAVAAEAPQVRLSDGSEAKIDGAALEGSDPVAPATDAGGPGAAEQEVSQEKMLTWLRHQRSMCEITRHRGEVTHEASPTRARAV